LFSPGKSLTKTDLLGLCSHRCQMFKHWVIETLLPPARRPSRLSFGYYPTGSLRYDLSGRLFGHFNLLKRLQSLDIMAAIDAQPEDWILDFGCGAGYITVELAKSAKRTIGIDVNPYVSRIKIPTSLQDRLEFLRAEGNNLPFPSASFDKILASEVLPMISDPGRFLAEIKRVIKPGGHLVVVNGTGLPAIREAYRSGSPRLRRLAARYPNQFPASYDDYCKRFQAVAGTARSAFLSEQEILNLLHDHGFRVDAVRHSPRRRAGEFLSWKQFELFLASGKVVPTKGFLVPFLLLSLLSLGDSDGYSGGLIAVATAGA
jgi:ubiquinone/menaquinone biosynthesis C-methylase UbiE